MTSSCTTTIAASGANLPSAEVRSTRGLPVVVSWFTTCTEDAVCPVRRAREVAVLDETAGARPAGQLVPVGQLQLAQHGRDVCFHRLAGDEQLFRDLLVGVAAGDEAHDLA